MKFITLFFSALILLSCEGATNNNPVEKTTEPVPTTDTIIAFNNDSLHRNNAAKIWIDDIHNKRISAHELVGFAKTLIGIPYKYASTDPAIGFDCSGFITYVFNHFDIAVPRSSIDFTNIGKEIPLQNAREGDLILFTGTVDSINVVGHMGIVTENMDTLKFIHSTSGRANAVTISNFTNHYEARFVKVTRVFSNQ